MLNKQVLDYYTEDGSPNVVLKLLNKYYKLGLPIALTEREQSHYDYLIKYPLFPYTIDWINEYRALWHKDLIGHKGKMGTKGACIMKLTRFLMTYPQYTKDDILMASKHYTENYKEYTGLIVQADYFIFKKKGKEEHSRLLEMLESGEGNGPSANDFYNDL